VKPYPKAVHSIGLRKRDALVIVCIFLIPTFLIGIVGCRLGDLELKIKEANISGATAAVPLVP